MSAGNDLAVLAVFFNPGGYRSTVANFCRFFDGLIKQGVEARALEVAFDEAPFYLDSLPDVARLRTPDVLWQTERMVNHMIAQLPARYTKVAWLDTDVLFENSQWHAQTAKALEQFPVVQPFQTAVWLDGGGRPCRRAPGVVSAAASHPDLFRQPMAVHPGFAWAARRELIEKHGVPDFCILGGSDRVFANAVYGIVWPREMAYYPPALRSRISAWSRPFHCDVRGAADWVEGTVYHLWHGPLANRRYLARNLPLLEQSFDPQLDIQIGRDGAWHWATDKPVLHAAVREYFSSLHADQ